MNETRNRWNAVGNVALPALTLFASLAVALSATVYAQRESQKKSADDSVISGGRVGTAPMAGSKVTLRLTFDNGAVFKVTQFEGAAIRISRNGSTVLIATHIDSENLSQVHAKIFKVFPVEATGVSLGEGIAEVGSLHLSREASEFNEGELACKIEVIQIVVDTKSKNETDELFRDLMLPQSGECCLNCSGINVCGCGVQGPCGSCCVGSCC